VADIDAVYECGEGWRELVTKLDGMLSFVSPDYEPLQIKEKFGTLRFYAKYVPAPEAPMVAYEIFYSLIEAAEAKSALVCEVCGRWGKTRTDRPWKKTLCSACAVTTNA
jgi:hypothetical protein